MTTSMWFFRGTFSLLQELVGWVDRDECLQYCNTGIVIIFCTFIILVFQTLHFTNKISGTCQTERTRGQVRLIRWMARCSGSSGDTLGEPQSSSLCRYHHHDTIADVPSGGGGRRPRPGARRRPWVITRAAPARRTRRARGRRGPGAGCALSRRCVLSHRLYLNFKILHWYWIELSIFRYCISGILSLAVSPHAARCRNVSLSIEPNAIKIVLPSYRLTVHHDNQRCTSIY